ncbi:MAG: TetR/AcrR family transcriptional regulator, partial [Gammaproteobacteria bacterium]|nr:TetR/AcrR family transcriptional regulator [Gammaproteobacteria bacterium]
KSRVMEVSLAHFSDVGIEQTNVGDILQDADCSVGSLYHHFGSKEGIAEALFVEGVDHFNAGLLAALLPRRTASTGIKAMVTFCCEWVTDQPQLAAFLLSREIKLSELARLELREKDRAFGQSTYDWFAPHVKSGELQALPTGLYMPLICGPTLECSRMWLSGRSARSPREVAAILAEASWQSVRKSVRKS